MGMDLDVYLIVVQGFVNVWVRVVSVFFLWLMLLRVFSCMLNTCLLFCLCLILFGLRFMSKCCLICLYVIVNMQ